MATSKKASKTTTKPKPTTAFYTEHSKLINKGSHLVIDGWLGAGKEAIENKMSASDYALYSLSPSLKGHARYSEGSIRTEVGIAIRALKKYKTIEKVKDALTEDVAKRGGNFSTESWASVKHMLKGTGQREAGKTEKKKKPAKKVETTVVRKKMKKAGVPQRWIDIVMYALDNE
jgi:hypothetical protein